MLACDAHLRARMDGHVHWPTCGALRWRSAPDEDYASLDLLGQAALVLPTQTFYVGILWIEKAEAIDERRAPETRLARLRYLQARVPVPLPPVLMVVRSRAWLDRDIPPGVLWTTETELWEKRASDPFAARWADASGAIKPLLEQLSAQPGVGIDPSPYTVLSTEPFRADRRMGIEERIVAARADTSGAGPLDPGVLACILPRRTVATLERIGRYPLYTAEDLWHIDGQEASRLRETLSVLSRYGLVRTHRDVDERAHRYALSESGLAYLAAEAALPPQAYARAAGVLEDNLTRHGMPGLLANRAHTGGVRKLHLAIVRALREAEQDEEAVGIEWWGEWACVKVFDDADGHVILKPDAEFTLSFTDPTGTVRPWSLWVVVEYDRGHQGQKDDIAGKIRHYYRYAAMLPPIVDRSAAAGTSPAPPPLTVVFVTETSRERARNIVATSEEVYWEYENRAVEVRAAWLPDIIGGGPFGAVWHRPWHDDPTHLPYLGQELKRNMGRTPTKEKPYDVTDKGNKGS